MTEEWFQALLWHLAARGECTPFTMAQLIHEALQIAEIEKYATAESRFEFVFSGASEEDLAEIMGYLTPLERSVVVLRTK